MANTAKTTKKCTTKSCKKSAAAKTCGTKTMAAEYRPREVRIPTEYEPISMWGYFGYEILFNIPLIGWIFCICFAFAAHNRNLRNFARSKFCLLILWIILFCVLAAAGVLKTILNGLNLY